MVRIRFVVRVLHPDPELAWVFFHRDVEWAAVPRTGELLDIHFPSGPVEPTAISWDVDDGQAHVELPPFEPDEVDAADLLMEMFRTSGWSDGY